MKIVRILFVSIAVAVLALAAGIKFNPSSLVLLSRDVKARSPFCSAWKASLDGHIKLRQYAVAEQLAKVSHLVKREAGLMLWSTPNGDYWVPNGDDNILPLLLAQEDRNIYGTGEWGVQSGDTVLDVGAYIGTWTRWALAHGAKQVIAIEPSPASVECLKRNLAAEVAAGKVIIYPKGIWDSEGSLTLFANSQSGVGNSFVEHNDVADKINSIPVTTIDKMSAELGLARVDFIKADVKGATERLMRGGSTVIRRDHPRIAVSTEEPSDDAGAIAKLAVALLPTYRMQCGPCLLDGKEIYTDVLMFR
ncbi:MAG TPA: FkbM family methyltransferase [Bryobacteraceae bacterium]|nr:FkbM family methyltransferase [Bryobacteraceae bacterium]